MKSKYIMLMMVLFILGVHSTIAQSNKKKATPKQKINKVKSNSTTNALAMDTVTKAPVKSSEKSVSKKQDKKDVKDEEVELTRPYQPTLSEGYKISNSPQIEKAQLDIPKMDYSITPKAFPTWYDVLPINAAKMRDEKPEHQSGNMVKLGYGNYDNAYGELFLNNTQNKDYSIGAHLKHFSSTGDVTDYPNSQFSDNLIDVYGKRHFDNETMSTDLTYRRNVINFNDGYDTASINNKQTFNIFNAQIGFQSNYLDKTKFYHDFNINLYSLTDNFNNNEFGISANGLLKASLGKDQWIKGNFLFDNTNFMSGSNSLPNDMLFGISPQYAFKAGDLDICLGANGMYEENDNKNKAHLYPKIDFNYSFAEASLKFYATFTGETVKNTFRTLSSENPFIDVPPNLENTNNKKNIFVGFKGSLSNKISFDLRGGFKDVSNMPFYVYSPNYYFNGNINPIPEIIPQNKFAVVYDTVQVYNAHLELSYQQSEQLRIILSGDYNHYTVTSLPYPWYKPNESIGLSMVYNMEKFTIKGDVFFLSDREATTGLLSINDVMTSVNLKPIIDVNIGIEYHYTKTLSFFLNLNNIANSKYQIWYEYPVQRFNLLGGLSYAF